MSDSAPDSPLTVCAYVVMLRFLRHAKEWGQHESLPHLEMAAVTNVSHL